MKKRLFLFAGHLVFWYVLFVLARIAFLLYNWDQTSHLSPATALNTIRYGFRLDLSMISYLTVLPGLLITLSGFTDTKWIRKVFSGYELLLALLFSSIVSIDAVLYSYWGFRLDATPLFYMNNLKAMTASVNGWTWAGGVILIGLLTFILFKAFLLLFRKTLASLEKGRASSFTLFALTILLFIPLRGGVGLSAVTISSAYFSGNQFANHAAINPMWNLAFSLSESKDLEKKYIYYDDATMEQLVAPLTAREGDVIPVLRTDHPNILLIIVESLTAKAVGVTGNLKGITPNLDSLSHEGILFDRIFASSDRTDKGIAAVVSGYPSLPGSTPLKYQKLTEKLSFIPRELKKKGYKSSFLYGGTLDFANYRSYLVQAGYDRFVSEDDFAENELSSKWGAWDHVLLNRVLKETPNGSNGFFKTILTLTSHEPFDIPTKPLLKGRDTESLYLNSLHYTDQAIGDFIRTAKTRDWWDNTLVVIIADHGSKMPGNSGSDDFLRQHIPMIWLGGALAVHDTVIHTIGSQMDLASTLLNQLNINTGSFLFSKNILSTKPNAYAFYTFNEGFGYLTMNEFLVYNVITDKYTTVTNKNDTLLQDQAKAYLQLLYTDFFRATGK